MSEAAEPRRPPLIRRILVALDASPASLAALRAAAELASRMEAELLGLFVEDVALLRLAESPYACEVLFFSAVETPLSRGSMEQRLRYLAEQAREALAARARQARIAWSFRTVRGRVIEEVLAAAGEADLLALGTAGWTPGARVGSTALRLAVSSVPVLLLPERAPSPSHFLVYFDGTPAAARALTAAAGMAERAEALLTVLLAADPESAERLQRDAESLVRATAAVAAVRYRRVDPQDGKRLARALKDEPAGTLVLGSRQLIRTPEALETLLRETDLPLLLLGES